MNRIASLAVVALVLATPALHAAPNPSPRGAADPVRSISFQEAVDLALAYNLGLKSTRLDALLARLSVDIEDAAWDPVLTGSVGGGESLSPSRSSLAGADVVDTDNFNFALGVTKPTRLGPSVGVNWRADRFFSNSTFNTLNPAYDTAIDVTLTVPLLQGRGRRVQESQWRSSRAGAAAAREGLVVAANDLIRNVSAAYWVLVSQQSNLAVLQKSVELARDLEAAERRKLRPDVGRSTKLDVTKAEAETKRREVALIQGRLELDNASDSLRQLILPFTGSKEDGVVLRAIDPARRTAKLPQLDALVRQALEARPDLKQTDFSIDQLQESVIQAQNTLRLKLDFSSTLTLRGVDNRFQGSAGDTLSGDTPSASAAITLTWPFGRRAARAGLKRAELELQRARLRRRDQVNGIIVEVRQAHRRMRTALEEIAATRQELVAARESVVGERKRLGRGSTTLLEVARLEENQTAAELRLVQSQTELETARIDILQATGTLFSAYGISWDDALEPSRAKR